MDIKAGMIPDLLIAPSGKCYSKAGLQRLLAEIFKNHVDNREHICGGGYPSESGDGKLPPLAVMP